MRDFKGMKRQRGRNRGGGGGQGGGKPQHNINRAFDSQGPDNIRVRGNAQTVYEKYQGLARDATSAGDRVLAENHLQHAEHYFRTLRAIQPNRPASEIVSRDSFASGYDIDFEDEAAETAMEEADTQAAARAVEAAARAVEAPAEGGEAQAGEGQPRFDREARREWRDRPERGDRPQGEVRDRSDRFGDRQGQGEFRADRQGQGQGGGGGGEFRDRGDRPRFRDRPEGRGEDRFRDRPDRGAGERDARPEGGERQGRDDRPFDRDGRRDRFRDRPERVGDERRFETREAEAPAAPATGADLSAGPPREPPAPVLRSEDGGVSELPGFLQASEGDGEGRRRGRRRRPREEGGDVSAPAPEVEQA